MEKRDVQDKGLIERAALSALMVGASLESFGDYSELFSLATELAVLMIGEDVDWLER
jgi:hypothetical protein